MSQTANTQPPQRRNLTDILRQVFGPLVNWLAGGLVGLGLGPDVLTVIGLILSAVAGYFAACGLYEPAAVMILVGGAFDALDGAVARLSNRVSRFGALLDSTLDRYGEALIFMGLGYDLGRRAQWVGVLLASIALFGSVMVSYTRARSEGLGIDNKVGVLSRVERLIILVLALLTRQMMIGLWVLAILTHVTVVQRMWNAFWQTRSKHEEKP